MKYTLLCFLFFCNIYFSKAQYAVGDFGSASTGGWSNPGRWSTWNGTSWVATASIPGMANNVFILAGKAISVTISGVGCNNLIVEPGGVLWTQGSTNMYVNVYGT